MIAERKRRDYDYLLLEEELFFHRRPGKGRRQSRSILDSSVPYNMRIRKRELRLDFLKSSNQGVICSSHIFLL